MPLLCHTETKSTKEPGSVILMQVFPEDGEFFMAMHSVMQHIAKKEASPREEFIKGARFWLKSPRDGGAAEDIYHVFELTEDASDDTVKEELISWREKLLNDPTL